MVEVTEVQEDKAFVRLLEYDNIEGLILASSITKKRMRSVRQHLNVGNLECMQVIQAENGNVDLKMRDIRPEDKEVKRNEYEKAKIVHLILRLTAYNLKCKLIDLYEDFGWAMY